VDEGSSKAFRILRQQALGLALLAAAVTGQPVVALATPIVDVVFIATTGAGTVGGASIDAVPGDVLIAELRISADAEGVSSYGVSLAYDLDLRNELDVLSVSELTPAGFAFSFTPGVVALVEESTANRSGRILTFEAVTLGLGPASQTFAVGRIELLVGAAVASDGFDLEMGLFNPGVDGLFDNDGDDLAPFAVFGSASVNLVPEPGTALLLGLGVIAFSVRSAGLRRAER
jgi:hypothetical protein